MLLDYAVFNTFLSRIRKVPYFLIVDVMPDNNLCSFVSLLSTKTYLINAYIFNRLKRNDKMLTAYRAKEKQKKVF